MDWKSLLQQLRSLEPCQNIPDAADDRPPPSWPTAFTEQVISYHDFCRSTETDSLKTLKTGQVELRKTLILSTRNALRFGLSLLSSTAATDKNRQKWQEALVVENKCHNWLCKILLFEQKLPLSVESSSSSSGDPKIRLLAARCLCNLVTLNPTTASVLLSHIRPQPPSSQQRQIDVAGDPQQQLNNEDDECEGEATLTNWVDLLVCNRSKRDVLAALVATLYNALMALPLGEATAWMTATIVEQNGLLISTLLRQMVSSSSATTAHLQRDISRGEKKDDDHGIAKSDDDDEAQSWIVNLFVLFLRHGHAPAVHRSIGASAKAVLPEHVVLWYGLRAALEAGNDWFATDEVACNTGLFWANLYSELVCWNNEHDDADDVQLRRALVGVLIDLLGSYLGGESPTHGSVRIALGTRSTLVQDVATELAQTYDAIALRIAPRGDDKDSSRSDRRNTTLTAGEQATLIGGVRLLGNVAYQCRITQDLIRTTIATCSGSAQGTPRTALHVILSTTSLSHTCFTLREWSVVALRNLLQDNVDNQTVVAELQAQDPVQSTDLADMGIRVDVDAATGNVTVAPLPEVENDEHGEN